MEEYHRAPVHNNVGECESQKYYDAFSIISRSKIITWGIVGMANRNRNDDDQSGVDIKSLNGGRFILVVADLSITYWRLYRSAKSSISIYTCHGQ